MIRTTALCTSVATLLLIAGCASSQYIISTSNGTLIQTSGQPKLNKSTGMYTYRDLNGNNGSIAASEVKQILEK